MRFKLSILSLLLCFVGLSQDYKVVHISGDIYSANKLRNIKTGDLIANDEKLNPQSESLNCILFSGVKKLVYQQKTTKSEGIVSDLFASMPERQLIGSRSEDDSSYAKLSDYFQGPKYLFLSEIEKIYFNNISKTSSDQFKFIAVDADDNKVALDFEHDILTFKSSALFQENEFNKTITIYKLNTASGEFIKEVELEISRLENTKMITEINAILSMVDENSPLSEQKTTIYGFLNEIYGGLNQALFDRFMSLNYSM